MSIPLGEVASVSTGFPVRRKVQSQAGGDVVLVQIKGAGGAEGGCTPTTVKLRNDGGRFERHLLRDGDLLFQSRGSRHPVAVADPTVRGIAAAGLHVIRPDDARLRSDFLAWWLNHPSSQTRLISDFARGTYIPFVSKSALESFPIPLPPLDVQLRIAEVDRLRRRERALRARLDALTQQQVDVATLAAASRTY